MAHQPIWGELVVVALKANARDIDPYCVFRVGNVVKRTKADQGGGLHPIWDDQVNIPVAAGQHQMVVQIYNKDSNPANLMADGVIELNKVLREKEHDGYFSLSTRGRPGPGKIYLELTFYPSVSVLMSRVPLFC
ncbi:hypothetical protein K501DRAFT_193913 [Backusella circina FSU 941]|nr:hypothetical protein K501DRAFT_193913 [Backusella circina FSU 941]